MELTGERYVPGMHAQIELEHLHRYYLAREYAKDKVVLDIASGEGYGSSILAESAEFVYGVDISAEAVAHATQAYSDVVNIGFSEGSCAAIPLPDASVDFVCSFETIEHHDQHHGMMKEILRVLKPTGLLLISSPDKAVYSDAPNYQNPFHVKELYRSEFESLIREHFKHTFFQRQKVCYGSLILGDHGEHENYVHKQGHDGGRCSSELMDAPYLIGMASNVGLPDPVWGILESTLERTEEVVHLNAQIRDLQNRNAHLLAKLERRRSRIRRFINRLREGWRSGQFISNKGSSNNTGRDS